MTNTILGFFFGILINIVDDINDYKVGIKYKIFFETLLVILTIYILYLDRNLGPIASLIFSLGGIIGLFFAPHIIDANIWRLIIALSIPPLLYYLSIFWEEREKIKKKDIYNFMLILTPLFIIAVIFSLLEDYLVPEEFSQTKLIERLFQCLVMGLFIIYLPQIKEQYQLSLIQKEGLETAAWGWLGYASSSVLGIIYFLYSTPLNIN